MTVKKLKKKLVIRPPFKSKHEQFFFDYPGEFEKFLGSPIKKMVYEPVAFTLVTGSKTLKYTPDAYVLTEDFQVAFVEIKASRKARDFYYTRARLQATSLAFPEFRWILAIQKPRSETEWTFEEF